METVGSASFEAVHIGFDVSKVGIDFPNNMELVVVVLIVLIGSAVVAIVIVVVAIGWITCLGAIICLSTLSKALGAA